MASPSSSPVWLLFLFVFFATLIDLIISLFFVFPSDRLGERLLRSCALAPRGLFQFSCTLGDQWVGSLCSLLIGRCPLFFVDGNCSDCL